MRGIVVGLVAVLLAVSASAQKPMAVSTAELNRHVLWRAPVEYPAAAKAGHVSGAVVLLVQVSAAGRVTHLQVLNGPTMLTAAAEKSVEQWEFRPFMKNGAAVAVAGLVRVIFNLGRPVTAVETFLNRVRAKYATEPGLAAKGFHCRVEPEWREFPQLQHVPPRSPFLERLMRTRVRLLVPAAEAPVTQVETPKKPKLNVTQMAQADELVAATRRMVDSFYQTWLPFGIVGPTAPPDAGMKTVEGKRVIQFRQGQVTDWMSFDATSRMLHFTELMPGGDAVEESPHFVATPGGLLYTGTDFVMHHASSGGETDTHGAYRIEYQQVDGFRLPKMVEVVLAGSLDVHFRFTECNVGH